MNYMGQALSLARLALGQASPNPAVGAVVVKEGIIVGQGYTQPAGSHHAEVLALKQAGQVAQGGVMYVTLEPCCHYGRTPPCTRAIISAGISEVHMAMIDPNPLVSGVGLRRLREAGVAVEVSSQHSQDAARINEEFLHFMKRGVPLVTLKAAVTPVSLGRKVMLKLLPCAPQL